MIISLIKLAYLPADRQFAQRRLRATALDQMSIFGNTRMAVPLAPVEKRPKRLALLSIGAMLGRG
jgi:hypothetical protein